MEEALLAVTLIGIVAPRLALKAPEVPESVPFDAGQSVEAPAHPPENLL